MIHYWDFRGKSWTIPLGNFMCKCSNVLTLAPVFLWLSVFLRWSTERPWGQPLWYEMCIIIILTTSPHDYTSCLGPDSFTCFDVLFSNSVRLTGEFTHPISAPWDVCVAHTDRQTQKHETAHRPAHSWTARQTSSCSAFPLSSIRMLHRECEKFIGIFQVKNPEQRVKQCIPCWDRDLQSHLHNDP